MDFGGLCSKGRFFAYALRSFLLHPWKGHLTPGCAADSFNFYCSAARCSIERAFGQLVLTFPILTSHFIVRHARQGIQLITVCALLHNFRKKHGIPLVTTIADRVVKEGQFATELEAMEWARDMGDNMVGARENVDRHVTSVSDTSIAKGIRNNKANDLFRNGRIRPGSTPRPDIRLPEETDAAAEGLCS